MPRTIRSHELHIPTWFGASELQPHVDDFVRYVRHSGYSESTLHVYRNSVAHFAHWMSEYRIALVRLDERDVRRFLSEHLPICRCGPLRQRWLYSVRAALRVLLRFLRSRNLIEPQRSTDPAYVTNELQAFAEYQEHVCGLTPATREASRRRVRALLLQFPGTSAAYVDRLTDKELKRFLTHYTANCTPRSRATVYWSIRGYLHFKALTHPNAEVLCQRLPRFAAWRLASLPKSLSTAESRAMLAACRGHDPVSRRDYAIIRCLHDLGLRTIEVSRLQLDDVDWMAGTVRVRGKGHRIDVMPIPASTGRAIISYLRHGRPRVAERSLFLRHRPHHWGPATVFVIRAAVRYAAQRAGLTHRVGGPHIFRHTLACRLVQRSASLKAIADLLRHRSLTNTRIYAKVDLPALSAVALPWPGRRP